MGGSGRGAEDEALTVRADLNGSTAVLRLAGELDVATASLLERTATELPGDAATVVLDLSQLAFLDSSGLTAIVRVHKHVSSRGGEVTARGARPFIREILKVAGLDQVIPVDP